MGNSNSQVFDNSVKTQNDDNILYMILVRHGLSYNNYLKDASLCGMLKSASHIGLTTFEKHCAADLTLPGRVQARAIGQVFASDVSDIYRKAVFCSQMERAIETAAEANVGMRKVDKAYGNSIVPVPYFYEVNPNVCITPPSTEMFADCAKRTGTVLKDEFPIQTWHDSIQSHGFETLQSKFKETSLPFIKRQVGNKWAIVVGHGRHIRKMLGWWHILLNTEPVFVAYNVSTQKLEHIWCMQMHTEYVTIPRDCVLTVKDHAEASAKYKHVCDSDSKYRYHKFIPR